MRLPLLILAVVAAFLGVYAVGQAAGDPLDRENTHACRGEL